MDFVIAHPTFVTAIVVALIGLAGTIIAALIGRISKSEKSSSTTVGRDNHAPIIHADIVHFTNYNKPNSIQKTIDPPLAYQINALEQFLDWANEQRLIKIAKSDLNVWLGGPNRDGIDPPFEPLSLPKVSEEVANLIASGRLTESEGDYLIPRRSSPHPKSRGSANNGDRHPGDTCK